MSQCYLPFHPGFDIDGIFADFPAGYMMLHRIMSGRNLFPGYSNDREVYPDTWNFATDAGYTKEEDGAVWKRIASDETFWKNLNPIVGKRAFQRVARLALVNFNAGRQVFPITLITDRAGSTALTQTYEWLNIQGVPASPAGLTPKVHIGKNKMELAGKLGLSHYIDDRPDNFAGKRELAPNLSAYLLTTAYNRYIPTPEDTTRVTSLNEYLDIVEVDAGKFLSGPPSFATTL